MSTRGRPRALAGQEESVIAMYLGGATIGDLEEHFGCSDTPIIRILDEAGIERRRGRPPGRGAAPRKIKEATALSAGPVMESLYEPVGRPPVVVRVPSVGPRASRQVTDEVFRRDGYRCRMCGSGTRLAVEYAIPPDRGGNSRNPKDLRTVCAACATKPVEETEPKGFLRRLLGL